MNEPTITSRQNTRVKAALRLRERRARKERWQFLIDGARELLRALDAGVSVDQGFVCRELCQSEEARQVADALAQTSATVDLVTPEVFEKLAFGDRAEGVLAVAATPDRTLETLILPACPLIAVLENVEKPGNLGAVLRTADAVGIDALLVTGDGTDLYNPNTIRASLGTVFSVPVFGTDNETALAWLAQQQVGIFTARVDAGRLYTEADFRSGSAIVLGSEAAGLSDAWRGDQVTGIRLPMHGQADSLNVSVTASVLLYEAVRQRG